MTAVLAGGLRFVDGLLSADRCYLANLLCVVEQESERDEEDLEDPDPPADKQPVEQAVGMLLYHSSAGSDASGLNLLNEYVFTVAFLTNHHLSLHMFFVV